MMSVIGSKPHHPALRKLPKFKLHIKAEKVLEMATSRYAKVVQLLVDKIQHLDTRGRDGSKYSTYTVQCLVQTILIPLLIIHQF